MVYLGTHRETTAMPHKEGCCLSQNMAHIYSVYPTHRGGRRLCSTLADDQVLASCSDDGQGGLVEAKLVIAGNHDLLSDRDPKQARAHLTEAIYLRNALGSIPDDGCALRRHPRGLKFCGSPVNSEGGDWAFSRERLVKIRKHWDRIPDDTDVLITHEPPTARSTNSTSWPNAQDVSTCSALCSGSSRGCMSSD